MTDNPAISLFLASEFDPINVHSQQFEEIEAIEDDKRRNEELKEMMQNAFDDLEDEDKQSVNSSYLTNQGYCDSDEKNLRNPTYQRDVYNKQSDEVKPHSPYNIISISPTDYNTNNQLEVLYSVRLREIERLHDEINNLKKSHSEEITSLLKQLAVTESEKERSEKSLKDYEKFLAEEKAKFGNNEKDLLTLRQRLHEAEAQKREVISKLEIADITNQDLEQRLISLEKCSKLNSDNKQFDMVLNKLNLEHKQDINNMQNKVDDLSSKLQSKEIEFKRLEKEFIQLQRTHESMLIEKSDSVNRLAKKLEETQSNYQQLITSTYNDENPKTKLQLESLRKENEQLSSKLQSIMTECETLRYDIFQYENLSKLSELLTTDGISPENESVFQIGYVKNESLRRLKDELYRAMVNQKAKRNEIKELQGKLTHANELIKQEKGENDKYAARIKVLEDELKKLNDSLRKATGELANNTTNREKIENLEKLKLNIGSLTDENRKLKSSLLELENKVEEEKKLAVDRYSKEYMKFHEEKLTQVRQDVTNDFQRKVSELESRLEESVKECNEIKELYTDACINKDKLISSRENLKKELDDLKNINTSLNDTLTALKEENERLLMLTEKYKNHDEEICNRKISHLETDLEQAKNLIGTLEQQMKLQSEEVTQKIQENLKLKLDAALLESNINHLKEKVKSSEKLEVNNEDETKRIREADSRIDDYQEKYRLLNDKYLRDIETLKLNMIDRITKMKILHSENIAQLRIEHAQEISQLKIKHRKLFDKVERDMKKLTMQAFDEEISKISMNYKSIIQHLMLSVDQYKLDVNEQISTLKEELNKRRSLEQTDTSDSYEQKHAKNLENELLAVQNKHDEIMGRCVKLDEINSKLLTELDKLQEKYENSRKAAIHYKQLSEKRSTLLQKEIEHRTKFVASIQKQIDEAIESSLLQREREYRTKFVENIQKQIDETIDKKQPEMNVALANKELMAGIDR